MADREMTADELEALTTEEESIPIPPQMAYGISIFAMTDGPPIVHVSPGENEAIPYEALMSLLYEAADNVRYQMFKRNLAADSMARRDPDEG